MRHCSSCAYCILDIKALKYCGVVVNKCKLTEDLVLTPFIDGIMCKCYKKRFATPGKTRREGAKKMRSDCYTLSDLKNVCPEPESEYGLEHKDDFVAAVKQLNQLRHPHVGVDKYQKKSYTAGNNIVQRRLIHCGECRYWVSENEIHDCLHPGGMIHPHADSFCSNGLRKDDLNG